MRIILGALVLTSFGCATSGSTRFTSVDELKKITSQPKPTKVFDQSHANVDSWQLIGPLPDDVATDAPHETKSLFAKTLLDAAATTGFSAKESAACVAREAAHFFAAKANYPSRSVRHFIEGRCGAFVTLQLNSLSAPIEADRTDAQIVEHWQAQVTAAVQKIPAGAQAGIGWVRENGKGVLMVAWVKPEVSLEPVSMLPDADGFVWLRGTSTKRADFVAGSVNQGPTGSADCVNTNTRQAPAFELKCPVAKADASAWVGVTAHERGRVLGFEVARVLVRPNGTKADTYVAPTLVSSAAGAAASDFASQLNGVRKSIGLNELIVSQAQGHELHELTPFFLAAMEAQHGTSEDLIALGVMAGWHVENEIMKGTFGAGTAETDRTSTLVADMLESPGYRQSLLSPRAGVLAVGLYQEGSMLGAVVSTYELVQAPTWPATSDKVLTALNAQRARNGKKPVQWVLLPGSGEAILAEGMAKRRSDSEDTLRAFMDQASNSTGRAVHGWRVPTFDLDDIQWPPELLSNDSVDLMFFVATERAGNDPWGRYVLMISILGAAAQPST